MCTAISYKAKDFYFGRTLDYESSYGEEVVITPRHYQFSYAHMGECTTHYAMRGMAHVAEEYPLYYEAVNEKGLGMAGLNFVGNACYGEYEENAKNVATYEFIPWVLGACESVEQVRDYLIGLNLIGETFAGKYPASSLHWLIADEKQSITVEMVEEGLRIYDNPVGVITNNPPFDKQMFLLNNYMQLSPKQPENHLAPGSSWHLQPRNGSTRSAGRSIVDITFCQSGIYKIKCRSVVRQRNHRWVNIFT